MYKIFSMCFCHGTPTKSLNPILFDFGFELTDGAANRDICTISHSRTNGHEFPLRV